MTTGQIITMIVAVVGSQGIWNFISMIVSRRDAKKTMKSEEIQALEEKDEKHEKALLAILHDRLYQSCKYFIHLKWITASALKNLEYIHDAYAGLGGNSTGTELFERCKKLPIKEEDEWLDKL